MGVLETVIGNLAAAAVTTPQAFAAATPQTFSIRSTGKERSAMLLDLFTNVTAAGAVRVRSARMHDSQQAINLRAVASNPQPILPSGTKQGLYSQDLLTVEYLADVAPGAAAPQGIGMQIYYPELGGGAPSKFRTWAEVEPMIEEIYGQEMTPTSSATAGLWGAGQVLNANFDQFKAGKNYALLGYTCSDLGVAWSISGSDTGNYQVGGPMTTIGHETRDYFRDLSDANGLPLIPVISADNKLSTVVQVATLVAATAAHVGLIFAQLSN